MKASALNFTTVESVTIIRVVILLYNMMQQYRVAISFKKSLSINSNDDDSISWVGKGGRLTNLLLHILKSERMANPASPSPSDGIKIQNLLRKAHNV